MLAAIPSRTYHQLDASHAQAITDIESELARRNPTLVSGGTIIPKNYAAMLANPSYRFLGVFEDGQLIGFGGSHYVAPPEIEKIRHLMGKQFVSSGAELTQWNPSNDRPINLLRLKDGSRPIAFMFSLRVHPDYSGFGTQLNLRRIADAFDESIGASHVMVDIAADNGGALTVQRKSAAIAGTTVFLAGAAHDIGSSIHIPCITVVHAKGVSDDIGEPVLSLPIDRVLGKNIDRELFHRLTWVLDSGWIGLLAEDRLRIARRPVSFSSPNQEANEREVLQVFSSTLG